MNTKTEFEMLTEAQFDAQWQQVQDQCKAIATEARGKQDQLRAKFLAESGWTQQAIAERIGKTQQWVDYHLRFGRFLDHVTTTGCNELKIPPKLTERRFRDYWSRSNGPSEASRFSAIIDSMEEDLILSKQRRTSDEGKALAEAVFSAFKDGKWKTAATIANKVDSTVEEIKPFVERMKLFGSFNSYVETRQFNEETQYKVHRGSGKKVIIDVLKTELEPFLKQLDEEGKVTHMANWCPARILTTVAQIRNVLRKYEK